VSPPVCQRARRRHRPGGFSLLELLVCALIGALLISGLTSYDLSQRRANRRQETVQRQRLEASRAADWIAADLERARSFSSGGSCAAAPAGLSPIFSITTSGSNSITYYGVTAADAYGDLVRCGPPPDNPSGAAVSYLVASTIRLLVGLPPAGAPLPTSGSSQIRYTLEQPDLTPPLTRWGFAGLSGVDAG